MKALQFGALRYLAKPVELHYLVKVAGDAVRLHCLAKAKRQALELAGGAERETLTRLGCDEMQGYLFARPAEGFPFLHSERQSVPKCPTASWFKNKAGHVDLTFARSSPL